MTEAAGAGDPAVSAATPTDRVVCLAPYPGSLLEEWVAGTGAATTVVDRGAPRGELLAALAGADIVIGDPTRAVPMTAELIAASPRARLLIHPAVGLDGVVDLAAAQRAGLRVVSAPGYNAGAVADWTVLAMLLALRRPVDLREAGWSGHDLGRELSSVRVGLVGFGAIGTAVARRLTGFGTEVWVTDSTGQAGPRTAVGPGPALDHAPHRTPDVAPHRAPDQVPDPRRVPLAELLAGCDVVSLHLPLTEATRGLIGARELASMREGSILINAARGAIVDEAALVAALRAGRPAFAVLDTYSQEPLPAGSGLRALSNVVLSPHLAAGTWPARERVRSIVRDALRAELTGGRRPPAGPSAADR